MRLLLVNVKKMPVRKMIKGIHAAARPKATAKKAMSKVKSSVGRAKRMVRMSKSHSDGRGVGY